MGNTKRTTKQSIKQRETMENELTTNKRTQSVTQRIHARPRKSAQIVKHKRVMKRKLIDVMQLDSRPDIELACDLINIHIDASFNEYQGDFDKLF